MYYQEKNGAIVVMAGSTILTELEAQIVRQAFFNLIRDDQMVCDLASWADVNQDTVLALMRDFEGFDLLHLVETG